MTPKPIKIIGGGLAGLALGIELRQRNIPAVIYESTCYPRHKVCGEFISGKGQLALMSLAPSLVPEFRPATTVAFFSRDAGTRALILPRPAWCVSRHVLDQRLSIRFQESGGDLKDQERWTQPFTEAIVRATGRRPSPAEGGWRWFGLKAHAVNVSLTADLEMHFIPQGYVGLCRLSPTEVNICGLFRNKPGQSDRRLGLDGLRGAPDSILHKRLKDAIFQPGSRCAVAGLNLTPDIQRSETEFAVGDALTMIPPITGNGMSIALESAQIAAPILDAFSCGHCTWEEAKAQMQRDSRTRFGPRLLRAQLLHKLLFASHLNQLLIPVLFRLRWTTNWLFAATR